MYSLAIIPLLLITEDKGGPTHGHKTKIQFCLAEAGTSCFTIFGKDASGQRKYIELRPKYQLSFYIQNLGYTTQNSFTRSVALMKSALKPTDATWSAHDGECRNLLGYMVLNVQCKTLPQTLPIKFYVFEDLTRPTILLSYAASSRLGIVQFTVPNETPINFPLWINAIACNKTVTCSQHQEYRPQNSHNRDSTPKSIIKQLSQDHQSKDTLQQDYSYHSKTINCQ